MSKSFKEAFAGKSPTEIAVGFAVLGTGFITAILGFLLLHAVIEGIVTMLLWQWLIVPTFGLAPLTLPQAMGVSLFASLLTTSARKSKEKVGGKDVLIHVFLTPLSYVVVGFLVSLFL